MNTVLANFLTYTAADIRIVGNEAVEIVVRIRKIAAAFVAAMRDIVREPEGEQQTAEHDGLGALCVTVDVTEV